MAPHVKSKRKTLKHKHKVEKKVRQHHRAVRRANRNKPEVRKIRKKDPGIPNLWPFKQQMMEQLERKKAEQAEAKKVLQQARREAARIAKEKGIDFATAELMVEATKRNSEFENREELKENIEVEEKTFGEAGSNSRRAFMKEFRKVMESSQVILEVLDARDPIGCRCYDAERAILASSGGSKRIVLVLNKVDMIPKAVADKWLAYLRNEYPTIAFRASLQEGRQKGQADMSALAASSVNSSECLGAANLLSLLKNYSRSKNVKSSIAVGVIGYPNVGKSSLINSLKRARAVAAGAMPGLTRCSQEVHLDKNIRLIDCPGIVFSTNQADALVLRNCISIEQLYDPISPIETIIKRVGTEPLMVAYSVPQFETVTEFLAFLCKTRGKYRSGGAFDVESAAKAVLRDWNSGKIPFYTMPPKGPKRAHLSAAIVQQWGKEFNLQSIQENERMNLESLPVSEKRKGLFARATPTEVPETTNAPMTDGETGGHPQVDSDVDGATPTFHVATGVKLAKASRKKQRGEKQDKMEQ